MEKFRESNGLRRRVLVVDDEMINREILGNILNEHYEVTFAENGRQAYDLLQERDKKYSLILLDLFMPEMDGFEFMEKLKSKGETNSIPVIVMTSEKTAEVKSIKLGAVDFITKPYDMPEVILARCERIIELYEDKSIIRSAEKDGLTGLYSKDFFFEYIRQIENYNQSDSVDAVVFNVERFKLINELHGRVEGDNILCRIADIISQDLEGSLGIGCRVEADTFYVYCYHKDNYDDILELLRQELSELSQIPKVRLRIGVYSNVDKEIRPENWFDRAKAACDRIRGDYTQQISYYSSEQHERELYQERLINDIVKAIADKDLRVFFQPKYDIQSDKPVLKSAEALIRWQHPEFGLISPGDFIPLFESNGLIQRLDNFVWEEAAFRIKTWREKYGVTIPISVNVSRIDIYDPELEEKFIKILDRYELTPNEMMLEITESAYADNANALIGVVKNLREKGFRIEMDDFGSGYSSLNMLTTLPIDVLKMDMKFVRNMNKDEKSMKLVELVLDIAKFLNVPVVAEGVEEESQLSALKKIGCDLVQGYYFSKPVPPDQFERLIEKEVK